VSVRAPVIAAVPTLFDADGSVDLAANRALYAHVSGLLDGLLVAGTTGEFPSLSDEERLSLVELAVEVAGPSRVIAHVGAPSAFQAARLAAAAAAAGAARLAAITPYYLPVRPDDLALSVRRLRRRRFTPTFSQNGRACTSRRSSSPRWPARRDWPEPRSAVRRLT
jgi:dihydrodipicolinate synthase/N-acetylneuraminate lyase